MKIIIRVKNGEIIEVLSDEEAVCMVIEHDTEDLPDSSIFLLENQEVFVYEAQIGTPEHKEKTKKITKEYREEIKKKKLKSIWSSNQTL